MIGRLVVVVVITALVSGGLIYVFSKLLQWDPIATTFVSVIVAASIALSVFSRMSD